MAFPFAPQGTTAIPQLPACATTLLQSPSKLSPSNLVSRCFIFAISYTCFKLTVPTFPMPEFPAVAFAPLAFPFGPLYKAESPSARWFGPRDSKTAAASLLRWGPGTLPAPRTRFFFGETLAAAKRREEVGGVLSSKVKDLSGRTVTRAGTGVPTM